MKNFGFYENLMRIQNINDILRDRTIKKQQSPTILKDIKQDKSILISPNSVKNSQKHKASTSLTTKDIYHIINKEHSYILNSKEIILEKIEWKPIKPKFQVDLSKKILKSKFINKTLTKKNSKLKILKTNESNKNYTNTSLNELSDVDEDLIEDAVLVDLNLIPQNKLFNKNKNKEKKNEPKDSQQVYSKYYLNTTPNATRKDNNNISLTTQLQMYDPNTYKNKIINSVKKQKPPLPTLAKENINLSNPIIQASISPPNNLNILHKKEVSLQLNFPTESEKPLKLPSIINPKIDVDTLEKPNVPFAHRKIYIDFDKTLYNYKKPDDSELYLKNFNSKFLQIMKLLENKRLKIKKQDKIKKCSIV